MKPEVLTTFEEGMDYAELKGVIDQVRIRFRGKTFTMGFISITRLLQDFQLANRDQRPMDLRGYDKHFVVSEVTVEEMQKAVIACEQEGTLDYYLES